MNLPALDRKITGAYMLADPAHKKLKFSQSASGLVVLLPANAPDPIASVLVFETRTH